jgi:hypothetical protein
MGDIAAAPKRRARKKSAQGTVKGADRRAWPYRFAMVPLELLFIDQDYQRPLTSFVESIASEYDPALLGTLIVSERADGRMAVVDGQTRSEAMRRNEEPEAPCLVYHGLTKGQEAQLFADLQTKRRGMATYLRFRASLAAGRDPEMPPSEPTPKTPAEAVAITEIVTAAGFELDVVETPHTVKAIAALEKVYRRDPDLLSTVMDVIARAWPDPNTEGRVSGDMIGGLAIFLNRESNVDTDRLVNRLAATEPRVIRHRANALQEGSGSGSGGRQGYMADAILGVYMRGKSRGTSAT